MPPPVRGSCVPVNHEESPIISMNIPLPKDVIGKVKCTNVSTKTEIRYNKKQDENEDVQYCSPAFKITRSWRATTTEDNQNAEVEHKLQDDPTQKSLKDAESENFVTPADPITTTLPKEPVHEKIVEYKNLDPRLEKRKSRIKFLNSKSFTPISTLYRRASGISNKAKERIPEFNFVDQNYQKQSIDSATSSSSDFASEYRRTYLDTSSFSSDDRTSLSTSTESVREEKHEANTQGKVRDPAHMENALYMYDPSSMGMEPNMNVYKNRSARKAFMKEREDTSSGSSTVLEKNSEGLKVYRLLNVEKKLSYVSTESPNTIVSPEAVIKRYRTVENPIVSCDSVKYFTGFEKVFHDPLMNIGMFFAKNYDIPNRSETRIRTTLVSEIVDPNEVGEIEFNNFINSHNIEEEIPIHFTKLADTQVGKNDPRILRVADVITVAQIRKVRPEQLESRL